ncbi:MAG: hypothetical protein EB075_13725, partial [Bacteroidetes bacterium]|nr:hypothetical protein [Bacteroidota bacterium]
TVACVYDPDNGIEKSFNFFVGDVEAAKLDFIRHLDDAESLCSFNGPRFDIPFVVHQFKVSDAQMQNWIGKTFDYFEICKIVFNSTCSLNALLEANGEKVKTSNGMQAVVWAEEGNWGDLVDYCMMDVKLTHKISTQKHVILPLRNRPHARCRHSLRNHSLQFRPHTPKPVQDAAAPEPVQDAASVRRRG